MSWLRRRHAELDARVADARVCAEVAREQAELSRTRHEAIVEQVVKPLRKAGERNQFASMIRRSLIEGDRRET